MHIFKSNIRASQNDSLDAVAAIKYGMTGRAAVEATAAAQNSCADYKFCPTKSEREGEKGLKTVVLPREDSGYS